MDPSARATARLFIGLWPDDTVRDALCAQRREWTWPGRQAPVAREKLHMTLHFLGSVPRERLPVLVRGLDVPFEPFELMLDHAELWRGGIAVARPLAVPARLLRLHERLRAALDALQQRTARDELVPHVTLARKARRAVPPTVVEPIRWPVDGFALIESQPPGPYRVVGDYP